MIKKEDTARRTGKRVLLFSSGMDSYIINELEKPDVLLFIDNKSNYSELEMKYLKSLKHDNLVFVEDFINLSSIELDNMIMPARNLFLVTIASYFGEEIILGATAGDRSTDKDLKFADLMSQTLSHIYAPSHWCTKGDIFVNLKYKNWTKQQLVAEMVRVNLEKNIPVEMTVHRLLVDSFSCYHPTEKEGQCNRCKPDVRKFLAILGATGINVDYYYRKGNRPSEFFTPEVIVKWEQELLGDSSRGLESIETLKVLRSL
jgi:7-cyano-7-deazaguanine synthase in queuosine biosynthesis